MDLDISLAADPDRRQTESLCPHCLRRIPAQRVNRGDSVYLVKTCPAHGTFEAVLWRGSPCFDQWRRDKIPAPPLWPSHPVSDGCPFDCGLCLDHRQRSCTVILEITSRCDLGCRVCFADSGRAGRDMPPAAIDAWYRSLIDTGNLCNIQLSGGEPTLRDDLPAIVEAGRKLGFGFIQLNTNGLRLGRDRAFTQALSEAGLSSVFLQYDGADDAVYERLRGRRLAAQKQEAIDACARCGIGVVLVATLVPGLNTGHVGAILKTALDASPAVRGVHFQPIAYFGRYGEPPADAGRLTLPELMRAIEAQTDGMFKTEDFAPPGCENALCSFNGHFLVLPDRSVTSLRGAGRRNCCTPLVRADIGANKAIAFVSRNWAWPEPETAMTGGFRLEDGKSAGSSRDRTADGPQTLDGFLARARAHTLSVSAMAFQDAWTLTLDRVRECCIHVMAPDGRLIPFCLYNLTDRNGRCLYRM